MNVQIEPYCTFCGKPTNRVEYWALETVKVGVFGNLTSYSTPVVPIPAHRLCYITRRWGSGFLGTLIIGLILYTASMISLFFYFARWSPSQGNDLVNWLITVTAFFLPGIITTVIQRFIRKLFNTHVNNYFLSHIEHNRY